MGFCLDSGISVVGGLCGSLPPPPFALDYLVIAGGGGMSPQAPGPVNVNAAGGAGGIFCGTVPALGSGFSLPIVVGAGGYQGSNSCAGCIRTTCGGGGGGVYQVSGQGSAGGSGGAAGPSPGQGGCAILNCAEGREGGSVTTPVGGDAGGGGKCAAGGSFPPGPASGGQGGTFCLNQIFGVGPLSGGCYWVGGGGGGCGAQGGLGGGGTGGITGSTNGQVNTGGGGGGRSRFEPARQGGSGAVFLRYPDYFSAATLTGCVIGCCVGGYRAFFFCGSGTFCLPP